MKITFLFLLGFICVSQGIAQQQKINKELNFTLKFVVENDTLDVNKEYSIIVNGPFPADNSGHQGGRKENFRKTDRKGNFKLYIINPGEYEFIVLGKRSVIKRIENIVDYNLFVHIENK
jgi:hypothetical protein